MIALFPLLSIFFKNIKYSFFVVTIFSLSSCFLLKPGISVPDLESLENMNNEQLLTVVDTVGEKYKAHPKNKIIGIIYADVLKRVGRISQALAVMRQMAIFYPKDQEVLSAYGKALANAGYLSEGLNAIDRAQRPDMPDWRLISAKASILAQMGKHSEALLEYEKALELSPNESSIVSNMAMSYLLMGDLKTAEEKLRYASKMIGSDSRVRQNLALVVGLQGRIKEAYSIASNELSSEEAETNMRYIKSIIFQKDPWKKIAKKENNINKERRSFY
ncbi:tetratricopeptide repeat protein [Candidatus Liberibacter brunswickensis]|uniref:tetratricopeptide repeat protein n=1 Tax=Candidatus Liberibacter brunswickensis TaxID=1968796 RepID=UPI002FE3320D